jgi:hypothetical protein
VPRIIPQRFRERWLCRFCAYSEPQSVRGFGKTYRIKGVRASRCCRAFAARCLRTATLCQLAKRAVTAPIGALRGADIQSTLSRPGKVTVAAKTLVHPRLTRPRRTAARYEADRIEECVRADIVLHAR